MISFFYFVFKRLHLPLLIMPFLFSLFLPLVGEAANAEQVSGFLVQPVRCIALHQGQTCYQKLRFTWQIPGDDEYCLYELLNEIPLICWVGDQRNSYNMEFASDSNITYQIRLNGQQEALSEVTVEVAWVYKSSRKSFSRWRLF